MPNRPHMARAYATRREWSITVSVRVRIIRGLKIHLPPSLSHFHLFLGSPKHKTSNLTHNYNFSKLNTHSLLSHSQTPTLSPNHKVTLSPYHTLSLSREHTLTFSSEFPLSTIPLYNYTPRHIHESPWITTKILAGSMTRFASTRVQLQAHSRNKSNISLLRNTSSCAPTRVNTSVVALPWIMHMVLLNPIFFPSVKDIFTILTILQLPTRTFLQTSTNNMVQECPLNSNFGARILPAMVMA